MLVASFTATPLAGNAPLPVVLTNTSTAPGGITSWEWNLGDGVTSTVWSPTHTYPLYGTYLVSLTAQSNQEADRQSAQITVLNTPPPTTTVITYAYDGLYRLTRAAHSTGETFEYAYDAVGNRVTYTHTFSSQAVKTYTYDAANRLTSVDDQAYTWDNNGNLLNDGEKNYTYDQANRLINISANGLAWSAMYNGDGARLRQVTNGVPTTYTLDPSASSGQALNAGLVQVLMMQEAGGTTAYLYGVTRIGEQQPGGWAYHLSDALGSVRQLADDAAQVTLARGYMPYGEELWSLGSGSSAYGYTGEDWNSYINLVFLRARYMQPGSGVFLSHDPWEGDAERPGSMNGWNYAEDNPANFRDPSGLIKEGREAATADAVRMLIRLHGVEVPRDYGYVCGLYTQPGTQVPGCDASCGVWVEGNWRSIDELQRVFDAVSLTDNVMHDKLKSAIGNAQILRVRNVPEPVEKILDFIKVCPNCPFSPPPYVAWAVRGDIVLRDYSFDSGRDYTLYSVIHEMGHVWDWRTGYRLENEMSVILHTRVCTGAWCHFDVKAGAQPPPGDPRNPYAGTAPWEDWAEAFVSYVYPEYFANRGWNWTGIYRLSFVTNNISRLP